MPSRAKRYGQSCLVCRRRKVRCDGGRPTCAKCMRINERCVYNAHDATVTRLQNALVTSEQRLQQLERELQGLLLLEPAQCREALRSVTEGFGQRFDGTHPGRTFTLGSQIAPPTMGLVTFLNLTGSVSIRRPTTIRARTRKTTTRCIIHRCLSGTC